MMKANSSKKSLEFDTSIISSLDDFYALNLETNMWYKVQCSLAPLPRKGHSINVTSMLVDGVKQDHVILFGGFSPETNSLSNSVHLCTVHDVLSTVSKYENKKLKGNKNILEYAPPVTWKTLITSGKAPPPRYRHSACLIDRDISRINRVGDTNASTLLVVFGGIVGTHFDTQRAFNDIYILDLDTHVWLRTPFGPDGLGMRLSGHGPPPVYGHVAFAMPSPAPITMPHSSTEPVQNAASTSITVNRMDMIIFGGTTNVNMAAAGCQNAMYRYNTAEHVWTKLADNISTTGDAATNTATSSTLDTCSNPEHYPEPRYGHTAGVITGPRIFTSIPGVRYNYKTLPPGMNATGGTNNLNASVTSAGGDPFHATTGSHDLAAATGGMGSGSVSITDAHDWVKDFESVAVVFGGSNAEMCSANVFILDLSVRFHARHYYHASHHRTRHMNAISSHHLHRKMVASASLPLLHPRKTMRMRRNTSVGLIPQSDAGQDKSNSNAATPLMVPDGNGSFRPFLPGVVVTVPAVAGLTALNDTTSTGNSSSAQNTVAAPAAATNTATAATVMAMTAMNANTVDLSRLDLSKDEIDQAFVAVSLLLR
jgi:hypothetical protein